MIVERPAAMPTTENVVPPLVSVVMTVLNPHPSFFPAAVGSVLSQTLKDWELIIVEDPATRSGVPLLSGQRDPRIRHIVNPQRTSLVRQKNQGLDVARGEFVAMLDADDIAEPVRLARQVRFLQENPDVGVVGSQIGVIDTKGQVRGYRRFPTGHDDIVRAMRRIVPLSHPSTMVRREILVRAGGYRYEDQPAVEDYELWSRLVRLGVRFANHPETLLRYRIHPEQLKVTRLRETILGVLHVKELYWRGEMDWPDRLRMEIERLMLWLPRRVVLQLLMWTQYNDFAPSGTPLETLHAEPINGWKPHSHPLPILAEGEGGLAS